jgi:hypothetical protein
MVSRVAFGSVVLVAACGAFGSSSTAPGGGSPDAASPVASAATDAAPSSDASAATDAGGDVPIGTHIVFVTSGTFPGGEAGDDRCAEAAGKSSLVSGRTFKAWLSFPDAGAVTRLVRFGPWSVLGDGGEVAVDKEHLLPDIERAIDVDENGRVITDDSIGVWTGTTTMGRIDNNCAAWSDSTPGRTGATGTVSASDSRWTDLDDYTDCSAVARLYCFEQPADAGP